MNIDPRAILAQKTHEAAEKNLRIENGNLLKVYGEILVEHGFDIRNIVIPGTWDCKESPVGKCVYNFYEDPCRDSCIFCKDPEERP